MITRELQNTLNEAYSEAMRRRHEFLTLEHLLYAMLKEKTGREAVSYTHLDVYKRQILFARLCFYWLLL